MGVRGAGILPGPGHRVRWVFSGRRDGVSAEPYRSANLAEHVGDDAGAVSVNRAVLAATVDLAPDRLAVMQAAHGRSVAVVTEPGTVPDVDILVTTRTDLGVMALAADCATVALADPVAGVVAAVHSGWRGVAADASGAAVAVMVQQGANPDRMVASLGAAICPGCYEVSDSVRREVTRAAPAAAAVTTRATPAVDLHAGIAQQLRRAGVSDVRRDPTCTFEAGQDLFSYRRDGTTGRHGVIVRLEAA